MIVEPPGVTVFRTPHTVSDDWSYAFDPKCVRHASDSTMIGAMHPDLAGKVRQYLDSVEFIHVLSVLGRQEANLFNDALFSNPDRLEVLPIHSVDHHITEAHEKPYNSQHVKERAPNGRLPDQL